MRRFVIGFLAVMAVLTLIWIYRPPAEPDFNLSSNPFAGVNVKLYCVDRPWPLGWSCYTIPN